MNESPTRAVIIARFDLGFYVQLADGRCGQLRVPEMSSTTAVWDRSPNEQDGIGKTVNVYLVSTQDDQCYVSEYSATERALRDKKQQDWIKAQEQAKVGQALNVRIERKLEWGCLCRQQSEPFVEGIIGSPKTARNKQSPSDPAIGQADWDALTEGATVPVVVSRKEWAHWRFILYFSLAKNADG